jgi:hypothetical protein
MRAAQITMQKTCLIEVEDAVVAAKDQKGEAHRRPNWMFLSFLARFILFVTRLGAGEFPSVEPVSASMPARSATAPPRPQRRIGPALYIALERTHTHRSCLAPLFFVLGPTVYAPATLAV